MKYYYEEGESLTWLNYCSKSIFHKEKIYLFPYLITSTPEANGRHPPILGPLFTNSERKEIDI